MEKTICFATWKGKGLRGRVWSRKGAKGVEVGTARMCRKIQGLRLIILTIFLKGLKKLFYGVFLTFLKNTLFYEDEVQEEVLKFRSFRPIIYSTFMKRTISGHEA